LKDLKGTREQRKRNSEDAKTNFSAWLKQLDDPEVRKREGIDIEINRIAADKSIEEMSEYHTYEDGSVDQPFLNANTIKEEE
jgi:5-hydroxyisourate hydrolase-like protein (transthyretin family)